MRSTLQAIEQCLTSLASHLQSPLDLLPHRDLEEKLIHLELQGPPPGLPQNIAQGLEDLASKLSEFEVENTKVVVLGGGTGLSNLIGGDSRKESWPEDPFNGLKDIFPQTRAIVCVTDDGGSTGELLKDLPFIALGDYRHVLLSSIRKKRLKDLYGLNDIQCRELAKGLHSLFNYRFNRRPSSLEELLGAVGFDLGNLPDPMNRYLAGLLDTLFNDSILSQLLSRPHCLGNLLLAAAIREGTEEVHRKSQDGHFFAPHTYKGLNHLSRILALDEDAVIPCSLTPAVLQVIYSNGILATGEHKSGHARRGYPVDRLFVRFVEEPQVPSGMLKSLESADIIILSPGSLYTSTIPIFQVPGVAETIRTNTKALKILVANLWVQKGETDVVREDPRRRFYVSDLIKAYHHNIPGGVNGLFSHILSLGLQEIPGSILQSYAMENKIPIFLDRAKVNRMGFRPVEAGIFSQAALREFNVIQHDPDTLARTIRTLLAVISLQNESRIRDSAPAAPSVALPGGFAMTRPLIQKEKLFACERYAALGNWLEEINLSNESDPDKTFLHNISTIFHDILWYHQEILLNHLDNIQAIKIIDRETWSRSQEWDNVYSFYDPTDSTIKICQDVTADAKRLEQAFLVALGQALLGNYAESKEMIPVEQEGALVGKIFRLRIRPVEERNTFIRDHDLAQYLMLSRMVRSDTDNLLYTRLVNGNEGFTPPGLLFGLLYAWYLDNRFAEHVEYKMAVMRMEISDLIPEQAKMKSRRKSLIKFFRRAVFQHQNPMSDE